MEIDPQLTASLRGKVSLRTVPQGNAVLAFDIGQAFEVDDIGARIIEALGKPVSIRSLVERLASEYDVGVNKAGEDVFAFLQECQQLGIVDISTI